MHSFYSKYKALIFLNALSKEKGNFSLNLYLILICKKETYNGIDAETFRLGLIDKFASSHVSFTNTMFNTEALEKMKLNSYFNIIKAIKSK